MEGLLHDAWVLFVGIGSWMVNKLTGKLDSLEKENHIYKQQIKQLEKEAEEMLQYP